MKALWALFSKKRACLAPSERSLEQGSAARASHGVVKPPLEGHDVLPAAELGPPGPWAACSCRSSWSGLRRCLSPGEPKRWLKSWLYWHSLEVLPQLILFSWPRPLKKSGRSNFLELLQLDLQGSFLASKRLCSARALTLIPARWFPWGGSAPGARWERSLGCCPESSQSWNTVDSICAGLRCLWMVMWSCICTMGPSYTCKLRYLVTDPPHLSLQQLETVETYTGWPLWSWGISIIGCVCASSTLPVYFTAKQSRGKAEFCMC